MDKLLLLPRLTDPTTTKGTPPSKSLVVGYDGSPNSQFALDLAFCVAHQMQLASQHQVMIHVVYVTKLSASKVIQSQELLTHAQSRSDVCQSNPQSKSISHQARSTKKLHDRSLAKIDRVLWQARCLAEEWRGSFASHLRCGDLAQELENFVKEEKAALLFLGCRSASHPLVQALKETLPCPVIGIPERRSL
jgi:nucleotide-binding universal stress UspA family protein